MNLDTIDKNLLKYLQEDAKQTNKELSSKLDLSVTAVYERIKKLEREGVIRKYVALIEPKKVDHGFVVFCQIKLEKHANDAIGYFETEVMQLDEVLECFHISGEYDYLLKVVVKDMPHFRTFMVTKLTSLQYVGSTQSSFTISEVKNSTEIIL
jgi:Lrp/AsnC family transcriptional regulator, leucine-responsive regulatory protein